MDFDSLLGNAFSHKPDAVTGIARGQFPGRLEGVIVTGQVWILSIFNRVMVETSISLEPEEDNNMVLSSPLGFSIVGAV